MFGINLYALLGVGALILILGGTVAYERQVAKVAQAEASSARKIAADLTESLKESEADKARILALNAQLDLAVKERDQRAQALEQTKRKLSNELDALRNVLPPEDKACFSRDLPPELVSRLRDGPGDRDKDGNPQGPGSPAQPVQ